MARKGRTFTTVVLDDLHDVAEPPPTREQFEAFVEYCRQHTGFGLRPYERQPARPWWVRLWRWLSRAS